MSKKKNKKKSKKDLEKSPSEKPVDKPKNPFKNPKNIKNINNNSQSGNFRPNPAATSKTQHRGG